MDLQVAFFQEIKLKVKDHMVIARLLCDILDIKLDSAYRRMRGETELTFRELVKLSAHFNISLDAVLCNKNLNGELTYRRFAPDVTADYIPFLDYLSGMFEQALFSKEKEIILTAQEIPTIHTMLFDKLALFKLYVWYRNEPGNNPLTYDKFLLAMDSFLPQLYAYYNKVTGLYKRIPSVEIWSDKVLDPLLSLLEYHCEIYSFEDKAHAVEICRQLVQLVEKVESWSDHGYKEGEGESVAGFGMYRSTVDIQNNYTYISKEGADTVFIKMFSINGLFTDNEMIVDDTSKWIRNLISASQHLSGASARERLYFFNSLKSKVRRVLVKIEENRYML